MTSQVLLQLVVVYLQLSTCVSSLDMPRQSCPRTYNLGTLDVSPLLLFFFLLLFFPLLNTPNSDGLPLCLVFRGIVVILLPPSPP